MSRSELSRGTPAAPPSPKTELARAAEILPPAEIEALFQAARIHGQESEPDHEVGDLQQALLAAWNLMDSQQKVAFMAHWSITDILDWGSPPNARD